MVLFEVMRVTRWTRKLRAPARRRGPCVKGLGRRIERVRVRGVCSGSLREVGPAVLRRDRQARLSWICRRDISQLLQQDIASEIQAEWPQLFVRRAWNQFEIIDTN